MIPAGDSVWPLAQQYIDRIPPIDRKFAENKTLRAQIYAWLAASRPGRVAVSISSETTARLMPKARNAPR